MAHKKGQGSSRNGRDSNGQRRGVKRFAGERVIPGNILVRQVGNRFIPAAMSARGRISRCSPSSKARSSTTRTGARERGTGRGLTGVDTP